MRTGNIYNTNNTFGGELRNYLYDGYVSMAEMAKDIEKDFKFDYRCKRNIELIRDGKKQKSEKE